MKKVHFSDSQILAILKQVETGLLIPELCHEHSRVIPHFINGDLNTASWTSRL